MKVEPKLTDAEHRSHELIIHPGSCSSINYLIFLFQYRLYRQKFIEVFEGRGFKIDLDYKIIDMNANEEPDFHPWKEEQDLITVLCHVGGKTETIFKVLEANPNIKWIHTLSTGMPTDLASTLRDRPVSLTHGCDINSDALAEFVVFAILFFDKQCQNYLHNKKSHKWQALELEKTEGKTIGIVGLGSIGGRCAKKVKQSLGMNVIGLTHHPEKVDVEVAKCCNKLLANEQMDELLAESDFILNVLPLTHKTYHLYDRDKFKKMKKTSIFMNIGRGESVKEADLLEAIKTNEIAGAYLDVTEVEPLPSDHEFWDLDNVLITCHSSCITSDTHQKMIDQFLDNWHLHLQSKPLMNKVDKDKGY